MSCESILQDSLDIYMHPSKVEYTSQRTADFRKCNFMAPFPDMSHNRTAWERNAAKLAVASATVAATAFGLARSNTCRLHNRFEGGCRIDGVHWRGDAARETVHAV